jgi:uncharacterized protein (TIGR03086 family)
MSTENLSRAFAITRGVLANVTADQYDLPTPCASWSVRDLINHIVGGTYYFAASVSGGAGGGAAAIDHTTTDVLADYDAGTQAALEAFGAPGALDKMVELPFGTIPASVFIHIATTDNLTHAWDLAKATGQSTDLDADLPVTLLDAVSPFLGDALRGADGDRPFGPAMDAPDGASPTDRLAAFMGRVV